MKVGMYIRGNYYQYRGKIGIIIKNYHNDLEIAYKDGVIKTTVSDFIDDNFDKNGQQYKTSFNIIDLIEVGDYVNGKEVTEVMRDEEGNVTDIVYTEEVEGQSYSLLPIKDIVTREYFNSGKYKEEQWIE